MEMEARKEDNSTFSYSVVHPLSRNKALRNFWYVTEKGEKSKPEERLKISYDKIQSALSLMRIKDKTIQMTPCDESQLLRGHGFEIFLKKELHQITGSVKARGAVYSLLQLSNKQCKGVITASTGSFAHTLCYFGKKFGIPVTVMIPLSEAVAKTIDTCLALGAFVSIASYNIVEAHKEAVRTAQKNGLVYIDGNDHPSMIIGQATLGIEMMEEKINAEAVILPTSINGCGLITGIAMAIKGRNPNIKIIMVHSALHDPLTKSIREKTIRDHNLKQDYIWHCNSRGIENNLFDVIVEVNATSVKTAARILLEEENIDDLSAAIGLAAIVSDKLNELKGKRILIPVFGKMDRLSNVKNNKTDDNPSSEPCAGPSNA
ncbi:L-threonine ammonia-lyase-like [Temnothorax longispinosus]|uniref:L-threonine ammonia-lyase-like n=1 Tax=Temnothorax longispinosus TaxID=300112 RepID=UPI003A9A2DEF